MTTHLTWTKNRTGASTSASNGCAYVVEQERGTWLVTVRDGRSAIVLNADTTEAGGKDAAERYAAGVQAHLGKMAAA